MVGKNLIVGIRVHNGSARSKKLNSNEHGENTANEEKRENAR